MDAFVEERVWCPVANGHDKGARRHVKAPGAELDVAGDERPPERGLVHRRA